MDNANPVQPLQNPGGEQSQPSVLDRVFHREGAANDQPEEVVTDNVLQTELANCINPSCANNGKALKDGVCPSCGFNQKERY